MKGISKRLMSLSPNSSEQMWWISQEDYNSLVVTASKLNGSKRRFVDEQPTTFVVRSDSRTINGEKKYRVTITRCSGILKKNGRRFVQPIRVNPLLLD